MREKSLILFVEDFDDARELSIAYLEDAGFELASAVDGADALAKARELLPDLIVLDVSLPLVDGLEVLRRLKADTTTAPIPVVVMSGDSRGGVREQAEAAGAGAFVKKPCPPGELVRIMERALGQ